MTLDIIYTLLSSPLANKLAESV